MGINTLTEIQLDKLFVFYRVTPIRPPKKGSLPNSDQILRFNTKTKAEIQINSSQQWGFQQVVDALTVFHLTP